MNKISKIIYFFISTIFFIVFDLFASNAVYNNIDALPSNPVFDLISVQNTGAAFSILQNSKIFLVCFAIVAIITIAFYAIKHAAKSSTIAYFWTALLISGIFCNMYERIAFGYVRDYFKLNFINFPVFNISDIFINISVLAIVIIIIKQNFSKNNETGN